MKMLQLLKLIAKQVGVDTGNGRDMRILKESTAPEKLIAQIGQALQSASEGPGVAGQTPG